MGRTREGGPRPARGGGGLPHGSAGVPHGLAPLTGPITTHTPPSRVRLYERTYPPEGGERRSPKGIVRSYSKKILYLNKIPLYRNFPPFGGEGSTMFSCTRDDPLRGSSLPPFGGVGSLPQRGSEPSLANSGAIRSDGRKNPTEDASPAPGGTGLRPSRGKPVPPGAGDALGIGVCSVPHGLPARPYLYRVVQDNP